MIGFTVIDSWFLYVIAIGVVWIALGIWRLK